MTKRDKLVLEFVSDKLFELVEHLEYDFDLEIDFEDHIGVDPCTDNPEGSGIPMLTIDLYFLNNEEDVNKYVRKSEEDDNIVKS